MSSEEILMQMSQQLGELTGTVKQALDGQNKTNEALFSLCKDNRTDIDDLKGTKNKLIGVTIASSVGGGGLVASLMKLLGAGHGG